MLLDTLQGARVLVTGADGFIGSHLTDRLLDEGAEVRALAQYTSFGTAGWLETLEADRRSAIDVQLGDVRDAGHVRELVRGCDLVFHLAALIAIPYSYQAPSSFVQTNIVGTQHVLDAVRSERCAMINTSTSEVYGTPDEVPIRETHPLRGQSPYAATKIAADKLCESYARSFGTRVVTLRPFNTYGPRQSLRAVIPTVLAQLLAGAETLQLGSLRPKRDFTFVSDTVSGFVRTALADLEPGQTVQLGTGDAVSIGELVRRCCEVTEREVEIVADPDRLRPEGSEVEVLLSDPSRAAELIEWEPQVSLEDGLRRTVDWLKNERIEIGDAQRYHR